MHSFRVLPFLCAELLRILSFDRRTMAPNRRTIAMIAGLCLFFGAGTIEFEYGVPWGRENISESVRTPVQLSRPSVRAGMRVVL